MTEVAGGYMLHSLTEVRQNTCDDGENFIDACRCTANICRDRSQQEGAVRSRQHRLEGSNPRFTRFYPREVGCAGSAFSHDVMSHSIAEVHQLGAAHTEVGASNILDLSTLELMRAREQPVHL